MEMKFEKNTFKKRLSSMLAVDFKRAFTTPLFYIMMAISLVMPILILVMVTMMDGSVSVDPQTGVETVMEGFDSVWQIIGTSTADASAAGMAGGMSITSMCNINMMYFAIAVFVSMFVSEDFRSGYAKNLFTVRERKNDYVISKIIISFVVGAGMLIMFFVGSMIGGGIAGLPFDLGSVSAANVVMSMLSKIFLVSIFAAIFVLASVFAKQKLWLAILMSLGIGMLFFTMVPMITPLNSTIVNVMLCLIGGGMFSAGIGVGAYFILKKTSIV